MPARMTGLLPPRENPVAIPFAGIWTGAVPAIPAAADHFSRIHDWGLWNNDRWGDCGPVSFGNLVKLVSLYLTGTEADVTLDDVINLYRLVNPDFDPATGAGDRGVVMQDMLELLLQHGFGPDGRWRPLAFAKIDHTNADHLRAAIAIFGGILLGVNLQQAQEAQTDAGTWDYRRSPAWGGHAILSGRYVDQPGTASDREGNISWAQVVDFTPAFAEHQLAEAWVVIFPEHLGTTQFQEGISREALAGIYRELTGRDLPLPDPDPAPSPTPAPTPGPVPDSPAPTLGQIVHYRGRHGLQTARPAIVTATQSTLDPRGVQAGHVPPLDDADHVHLWVFTPSDAGGFAEYNVAHGQEDDAGEIPPGTWCWPPRA